MMPGSEAGQLEIRVLGPVEIAWDGRVIDIGGVKARALVARLLIDRHVIVSVDRLVDSLWGDHEGPGPEIALRSTISRLRKRLRDAGAPDDLIATKSPGYVLEVGADVTDAFRLERLVSEGRAHLARLRPSECVRLLAEAEGLWRGPAYSEVRDEPFARAEARRLEELLLSATETRLDAELTLGRHEAVTGELEALTSAHPLRERLWSQRMLALYRSGRQAEALRVFQDLRTVLVAELGIEPGHDVTWMEHAVLAQDPVLDFRVPPEDLQGGGASRPAPDSIPGLYQVRLPTAQREGPLIGRADEMARLRQWWGSVDQGAGRLLLVDGDPGIGKTRLVAELARSVERDALVLWGRCDEDPAAPFQPFAEAFGRYFQSLSADRISRMPGWRLSELSRLVPRLREYAPVLGDQGGDPGNERFRFFEAVTAMLNELPGGPVLLVIDDLHAADQPTLLLLRHLLRGTDEGKLGVVGLFIDTEVPATHRLRTMVSDVRAVQPVASVHLQGLDSVAVGELVQGWPNAPSDLVPQLCRLTDGNPLFLDELLRHFGYRETEQREEGDAPVPPSLTPTEAIRELVARRVSRLPEDVIYLLQAAAVAGPECEAGIVAEAAELTTERQLDAFDRAEESRLLRRVGQDVRGRYVFTHMLVRDAIYGELLRGRRVRYHHKIAVATEKAHADELDVYVNELAHHFFMGAALADADKATRYCRAAGRRALSLLAFEEAAIHFARSLEVAEQFGSPDAAERCDTLLGLAEAQNRAGDSVEANANFERAAALARGLGDAERLAMVALRAGLLSYLGIVRANEAQVQLLEEALAALPEGEETHLRAMVTARLALVVVDGAHGQAPRTLSRSLAMSNDAAAMARRLGDKVALGYALNARMHALWGIERAPERLATGTELGRIADDIGDELLALYGHMWRIREHLAQGDVDAVNQEITRFRSRKTGPVHPLEASYAFNVTAMMGLLEGKFESAEQLGQRALEVAGGPNELALSFYGALMWWTWWQRGDLAAPDEVIRAVVAQAPTGSPTAAAALALIHAEARDTGAALAELHALAELGWERVAADHTEGVTLAMAAAACSMLGAPAGEIAPHIYDSLRPYAGTVVVVRAPAAASMGPADHYLGLLAGTFGDLPLAEVHHEAALRLARRMGSPPFAAAAETELARTLRQRRPAVDEERVAALLRSAEESAVAMGLHRLARRAAAPD